jgi:Zn-dependent protease
MFGLSIPSLIARAVTLLLAFSVHEFAHAWTADNFGDTTPRANGRLTLNPLAHLDPMGTIMLLLVGFGWAKPVPINSYALGRHSSNAVMWVSLAGPMSNLVLAVLAAVPFRAGLLSLSYTDINPASGSILPSVGYFLFQFILINLSLMLFNLIPIAPLDGEKIADSIFPPSWVKAMDGVRPYGPAILLVVIFVLPYIGIDILSLIMTPVLRGLMQLLMGI